MNYSSVNPFMKIWGIPDGFDSEGDELSSGTSAAPRPNDGYNCYFI